MMAGLFDRLNPIEKRPDPALQRVSARHRPFMGGASRQRPIRRAVRVKTVQRVPRPLSQAQVAALLAQLRSNRDRGDCAADAAGRAAPEPVTLSV
jgi:hypothetical protein